MNNNQYVLVLDIGTSSVKSFLFDRNSEEVASQFTIKLPRRHPKPDWVEQDPKAIIDSSVAALCGLFSKCKVDTSSVLGVGISTQRESVVLWDKSGIPLSPILVWEDKRSQTICKALVGQGLGDLIRQKTGLLLDAYFSAPKLSWLARNAELPSGNIYWGTVDSWLLWNLLDKPLHITDYTNASRTLLFNIKDLRWDDELEEVFEIPQNFLFARPLNSWGKFGLLKEKVLGKKLPILAVAGDQQASLFAAGDFKITYGTGAFVMQNIGKEFALVPGLFTTLSPSETAKPDFALEGKVENVGRRVDALLEKGKDIGGVLKEIVLETEEVVSRFPKRPNIAVADGGVTQDSRTIKLQEQISNIKLVPQKPYHGTALGVFRLVKRALEG